MMENKRTEMTQKLGDLPDEQRQKLTKKLIQQIRSLPRINRRNIWTNFWKHRQDEIQGATRAERRQFWRELWEKLADSKIPVLRLSFKGINFPTHSGAGAAARRLKTQERVAANRARRLNNFTNKCSEYQVELKEVPMLESHLNNLENMGISRRFNLVELRG